MYKESRMQSCLSAFSGVVGGGIEQHFKKVSLRVLMLSITHWYFLSDRLNVLLLLFT